MAQTETRLDDKGTVTGYATAQTANAYATALDWKTHLIKGHKTIQLSNTGPSNALKYRLYGKAYYESPGVEDELVAESVLDALTVAVFHYERAYARLRLIVASNVADAHTVYQVDYLGYAL